MLSACWLLVGLCYGCIVVCCSGGFAVVVFFGSELGWMIDLVAWLLVWGVAVWLLFLDCWFVTLRVCV